MSRLKDSRTLFPPDINQNESGSPLQPKSIFQPPKRNENKALRSQTLYSIELQLQAALSERDLYRRQLEEAQERIEHFSAVPSLLGTIERKIEGTTPRVIVRVIGGQELVSKYDPQLHLEEGDYVAIHQRNFTILDKLPPMLDPVLTNMYLGEIPRETYEDVGGLPEILREIREVVEVPFVHPELFQRFHLTPPRGILLHGSPGTGKTLIAKAVAHASKARFVYFAAPEIIQKYIGEGARLIKDLFRWTRKQNTPTILFIDEIDALGGIRTTETQSGEREVNRTLLQLLSEMDGFLPHDQIRILAATNRIDILDPALLRPGRFDKIIELPLPDLVGRRAIFRIHTRHFPLYQVDLDDLARQTTGCTGADIKAICTAAAMNVVRMQLELPKSRRSNITQRDFHRALMEFKQKGQNAQNAKSNPHRIYS